MELVGPSKRKMAGVITGGFFALGQIILGLIAYFVRDVSHLSHRVFNNICFAVPAPSISYLVACAHIRRVLLVGDCSHLFASMSPIARFRIVPESARWLVSLERFEEADEILQKAARMNKRQLPERWWEQIEVVEKVMEASGKERKYNLFDLVRTPVMRRRSLSAFFCWYD
jgi:OCT family organic cation transporter-like MFS transporter 4/5